MLLGVPHDQLQLRDRVLQVVHQEGSEPVVGLELPAFGEALVGLVLGDDGGDVPADRLQEVAVLPGQVEGRRRLE